VPAVAVAMVTSRLARRGPIGLCADGVHLGNLLAVSVAARAHVSMGANIGAGAGAAGEPFKPHTSLPWCRHSK
jgi:hypothetical protein